MKYHLNELIRLGQNAFIKGIHIKDNIQLLFDVIDLTAVNEIPRSVFTADIFKSFSFVSLGFHVSRCAKYCFG